MTSTFWAQRNTEKYRNPPIPLGHKPKRKIRFKDPSEEDDLHDILLRFLIIQENNDDDDPGDLSECILSEEGEISDSSDELEHKPIKKEVIEDDGDDKGKKNDVSCEVADVTEVPVKFSPPREKKTPERHSSSSSSHRHPKKKIKKEYSEDSNSDNSSYYSSGHSRTRSKRSPRHTHSPSPASSEVEEKKFNIKTEPPEHLYGSYHCQDCNLTMNSLATYNSHVVGKRHLKVLKTKNIVQTVSQTLPPTKAESRYPLAPSGMQRVQLTEKALIQDLVEKKLKTPCPGLHEVIEIRGFSETSYYCKLCDSPCSTSSIMPHLGGFKHMLKCLKFFKPDIYEKIKYEQKYAIEARVIRILKDVEKKYGLGTMMVETDIPGEGGSAYDERDSKSMMSKPGTSKDFTDYYNETTVPDKTKSGYYCKLCEAFMNSEAMWANHIRGKRHLTNVRKIPGSLPSKVKSIQLPEARAYILKDLDPIHEPVVGLNYIRETQNPQTKAETYQCFLCGACLTSVDIIEHLLSQKHRIKYLQEIQHPDLTIFENMNIQDGIARSLVEEICMSDEQKHGRGCPEVFVTKNQGSLFPSC